MHTISIGTARDVQLSTEETQRYGRHLIMLEVGVEGEKKLKSSSVLIVGAGGHLSNCN